MWKDACPMAYVLSAGMRAYKSLLNSEELNAIVSARRERDLFMNYHNKNWYDAFALRLRTTEIIFDNNIVYLRISSLFLFLNIYVRNGEIHFLLLYKM